MFELTAPRPVHFEGITVSAPLGVTAVAQLGVIGTLFRGDIRQLRFDASGALLVLAGRGVRRLDPRTLNETGRWLPELEILEVHPCGDRVWVITYEAVFLAGFGDELGAPFAVISYQHHYHASAAGTRLALPCDRGVLLLDAATGTTREYGLDEAWYATLWSPRWPDWAMLSPSGSRVGVTCEHGRYTVVWDVETGAVILARDHVEASAIVDDARLIHVDHGSGSIVGLVDGASTRLPGDVHFEGAQVRGERLLVADPRGGFSVYEVGSMTRIAALPDLAALHGRVSGRVCAALSDTHVATYAVMAGVLRVTEVGRGGELGGTVEAADWIGGAEALSVGQGGRRVGVFREWANGRLDCVDLDAGSLVELCGHHEDITHSAITGDGRKVVVPCGSILRARTVHVGDFYGTASNAAHAIRSCVHELVAYGEESYAVATYTLRGSGHVGLHQAGSARAIAKVTRDKESPWRIAVGHDSDELLIAWESATILYDIKKRPKPGDTWAFGTAAVALGPRGFIAFQHGADQLHLRTPGTQERVLTLAPRRGHGLTRLAFSRDGALLFVGASDGVLEVRRSHDGTLLRALPLHFGGYVALQACGEAVWTAGADGLVHVVGVTQGAVAGPAAG